MNKNTQRSHPVVLSIVTFPIVAAIIILSITGVATVLINQKLSGQKMSLARAVLSAEDNKVAVNNKINMPGVNDNEPVKLQDKNAGEETQNRNMLLEGTNPTTNNQGQSPFVTEGEGYKITVHEANQNSNGLAAQERIKVQLRKSLTENTDFADKIEAVQLELENAGAEGTIQYRAVATKSESLFGIFKIAIPYSMTVDADGNIIKVEDQSIFQKILDAVSF